MVIDGLQAKILSAKDYHAFGSILEGRTHDSIPPLGFNGKEIDPELKGQGNSYDFRAVLRSPAGRLAGGPLGRQARPDWQVSYSAFANNPIIFVDPDGKAVHCLGGAGISAGWGSPQRHSEEAHVTSSNLHSGCCWWLCDCTDIWCYSRGSRHCEYSNDEYSPHFPNAGCNKLAAPVAETAAAEVIEVARDGDYEPDLGRIGVIWGGFYGGEIGGRVAPFR